jgi:hypothetical protein
MLKQLTVILLGFLVVSCRMGTAPGQTLLDLEAVEKATTEGIEITFHGEACEVDAPDRLLVGEYHFTLNDQSQLTSAQLYVARITEGHSYADLLTPQIKPGEYYPKPDWLIYAKKIGSIDPSTGQRSYDVTLEPGEHAVYVYGFQPTGEQWLWFCVPITAVERSDG